MLMMQLGQLQSCGTEKRKIMDFNEIYKQKLTTADEAVKVIRSGDWIYYGWCTGTVDALDKALAKPELSDINIRGGILMKEPEIFKLEDAASHFTWNSWHSSGIERKAVAKGFCFYSPIKYSELPGYYRNSQTPPRVAMFQAAPMDAHGYFNFGPNASHMAACCEVADIIIVEVNKNMPRCLGGFENGIHISNVDMIVEGDNPAILETGAPAPTTEVDEAVAKYIVDEIPDGACLQLGIGGMPNAVGSLIAQSDLKDLGVHTEMYVDAFVDIAKAGKITGLKKSRDKGRQVYAFGSGTKKLYDYLDENPECMSAPVNYTNDMSVIASIDNFISINNAVDIDLFGQINAESAGTIKPTLPNGSIVTDTRANINYFVTEYGIVNLKGLSSWQRAEALISVAHPDFRDQLIAEAEKMHIWRQSNKR